MGPDRLVCFSSKKGEDKFWVLSYIFTYTGVKITWKWTQNTGFRQFCGQNNSKRHANFGFTVNNFPNIPTYSAGLASSWFNVGADDPFV